MPAEEYDYIIVGGGTAGLVLAARLSEDSSVKILVIEAGDDQSSDPRVTTPAMWPALVNTPADWALETVPQTQLGGRSIKFPQGRILGGSSAVNGLTFAATAKSNIDAWAQLGNPGWDWTTMSKYFEKSYALRKPAKDTAQLFGIDYLDSEAQTTTGPLQLSFPEQPENEWPKVWLDTIKGLGYPTTNNPFSGITYGANINAESIDPKTRQRSFAANAYLQPALTRGNITVATGAYVQKVVLNGNQAGQIRAEGVLYKKDDELVTARTRREVLITAGTIHSPRLLEISGIGDAELLKKQGIDVYIDNPNVGENFQNHPMCVTSFEVEDGLETMDTIARQDMTAIGAAMEAYSKQAGPFATGGAFASAQLPLPHNDLDAEKQKLKEDMVTWGAVGTESQNKIFADLHKNYVHSILSSPTEGSICHIAVPGYATGNLDGTMAAPPAGTEKYFTIVSLLCHPLSRGSVHIDNNRPSGIAIDPKYLSNPLDLEILARHIQFVDNELIKANPLSARLKKGGRRNELAPAQIDSLETAKDYIKRTACAAHHFTGTCSMMPREIGGVVDADLKVYGTSNLRVCDASIIPLTPRVNPQATVYGVAEHAADIIKRSYA